MPVFCTFCPGACPMISILECLLALIIGLGKLGNTFLHIVQALISCNNSLIFYNFTNKVNHIKDDTTKDPRFNVSP